MPKLPSPYGDYGSYQRKKLKFDEFQLLFPSPYGDYGSYHFELTNGMRKVLYWCFRPLTGIMVLI